MKNWKVNIHIKGNVPKYRATIIYANTAIEAQKVAAEMYHCNPSDVTVVD
jgi:hypothetical protein